MSAEFRAAAALDLTPIVRRFYSTPQGGIVPLGRMKWSELTDALAMQTALVARLHRRMTCRPSRRYREELGVLVGLQAIAKRHRVVMEGSTATLDEAAELLESRS